MLFVENATVLALGHPFSGYLHPMNHLPFTQSLWIFQPRAMADGAFKDGQRTQKKADMTSATEGMRRKGRYREWSVYSQQKNN